MLQGFVPQMLPIINPATCVLHTRYDSGKLASSNRKSRRLLGRVSAIAGVIARLFEPKLLGCAIVLQRVPELQPS